MARFSFPDAARAFLGRAVRFSKSLWKNYRMLALWLQGVIAVVVIAAVLGGASALAHLGAANTTADTSAPTVTLSSISDLSGTGSSVSGLGTVRSVTEASLLAQAAGTVQAVRAHIGSSVPAGFIIAELDNASQQAAVLQAEGSYDAAIAAQAGGSPQDVAANARTAYTTAYETLDTLLKTDVDTFFGTQGASGPTFLIGPGTHDLSYFPAKRQAIANAMSTWQSHLATAETTDPKTLLAEADTDTRMVAALLNDIAPLATRQGTDASAAQLAALAAARAGVATLESSITAAKQAYQGQGTATTAGADANVKIALGALRGAQAQLEKTLIRAPISGTLNFMPLHVGDYVTQLEHVATVAQNGALEVVSYVSDQDRALMSVGTKVTIEDTYPGVVTTIAPALDPVTKQIEVDIGVTGATSLIDGQSVRVAFPNVAPVTTQASSTGPLLLPLTTLKLTPAARVVFSVDTSGRLVAHPVTIGDVEGDRIQILTQLPGDLRIVTDARGLSEGEKVLIAQ